MTLLCHQDLSDQHILFGYCFIRVIDNDDIDESKDWGNFECNLHYRICIVLFLLNYFNHI